MHRKQYFLIITLEVFWDHILNLCWNWMWHMDLISSLPIWSLKVHILHKCVWDGLDFSPCNHYPLNGVLLQIACLSVELHHICEQLKVLNREALYSYRKMVCDISHRIFKLYKSICDVYNIGFEQTSLNSICNWYSLCAHEYICLCLISFN